MRRLLVICALSLTLPAAPARADPAAVDAGALRAHVTGDPFTLSFDGPGRQPTLHQQEAVGFRGAGLWSRATRVLDEHRDGAAYVATLATYDPLGRRIALRLEPAGEGVIALHARVVGSVAGIDAMGATFGAAPDERFFGFGERSNAVDQRGNDVENYVAEGPYQPIEEPLISAFVPLAGWLPRPDATYFPMPWLLSSRGFGVTVDQDETSHFDLASSEPGAWAAQVAAPRLDMRFFAGPTMAGALRRYTAAVGRQPRPSQPAVFGPWWQPKGADDSNLAALRAAHAPASVVQTYTHYLPCGAQQGATAAQRARTARFHDAGLAVTTYFNPMICTSYRGAYERAEARGCLTRDPSGQPYTYRYTGSSTFLVGQVDFAGAGCGAFYGDLLDDAVRDGYDGWMEDFGEYTPGDAHAADGRTGEGGHNAYVAGYHGAARAYSRDRSPRPLLRFNRSGWRETAKDSEIVWGGDPSTGWGYDGLQSALRNGLSMGLSGVSLWGSDIGGYFALSLPQTTPELEIRWLELGFASGVMRTEADGFSLVSSPRAQIFDRGVLPVWARYARLRTQLYPYLAAAEREYQRTGMPLMRSLALAYPEDAAGAGRDDEEVLGPDLLVAPVMSPGARSRALHLPPGRWVDLWRSTGLAEDGSWVLRSTRVLRGPGEVRVPAPLDEIPLFVRVGAVVPLLPGDVQTLASYGAGKVVRYADRARRRVLLAFLRHPSFRLHSAHVMRYELRASLATLSRRFTPACIEVDGRRLSSHSWRYSRSTGALHATFRARSATVHLLPRTRCVP